MHGTSAGRPDASRPALTGWKPSTSFSGAIEVEHLLLADVLRQRELDEDAVDGVVRVEPSEEREQRRPRSCRPAARGACRGCRPRRRPSPCCACRPGSPDPRRRARPRGPAGGRARRRTSSTPSRTSARTDSASFFPSRIVAVMGSSYSASRCAASPHLEDAREDAVEVIEVLVRDHDLALVARDRARRPSCRRRA